MRQRNSYPKPFKSQFVQDCLQPSASVASAALSHGINADVVRKWLPLYRGQPATTLPAFIPLYAEPQCWPATAVIIELPLGQQTLTAKWPASDPEGCAWFVRGLTQ